MKKILLNFALASTLVIGSQSCHSVQRIDTDSTVDLSGKWNDADSRMTAETLTLQILGDPWLTNFKTKNNKKPVLIVGFVKNKSHEHIEAETFMKNIERSFIQSQKIRLVQGGDKREQIRGERAEQKNNASVSTMKQFGLEIGADFMVQGDINTIVDTYKKKRVVYYQVNLELTNIQTNEVVWIGEKKIKKFLKR